MRTFPVELGNFITLERSKFFKDRKEFANKINLDPSTVRSIEEGETKSPGLEAFLAISRGLKISPLKLIAIYEGRDPDSVEDPNHTLQIMASDAVAMLKHLPKPMMVDAMRQIDPKLLAELFIRQNGEESMRQDLAEAKKRHEKKEKR